jgi:hypothetical protein
MDRLVKPCGKLPQGEIFGRVRPHLHQESELKNLGANFEHFWLVVWPQDTDKC